jgi:hypothetical protein
VGVYPCKHCGAPFVSVTMTQEPHAPDCPALAPPPARTAGQVAYEAWARVSFKHWGPPRYLSWEDAGPESHAAWEGAAAAVLKHASGR